MESNKIDKLFRDKLAGHSVEVSAGAWDAIVQKKPKKKNNKALIYSIAASFVLLLVSTVLILQQDNESVTEFQANIEIEQQTAFNAEMAQVPTVSNGKTDKTLPKLSQNNVQKQSKDYSSKEVPVQQANKVEKNLQLTISGIERIAAIKPERKYKIKMVESNLNRMDAHAQKVEIFYNAKDTKQEELLASGKNKLKDIADEFSLEDFRKAKSQLITTALDLPKKIKFN